MNINFPQSLSNIFRKNKVFGDIPVLVAGQSKLTSIEYIGVVIVASSLIFVQAFLFIKVALLVLFFITYSLAIIKKGECIIQPKMKVFYGAIACLGAIWSVVGLVNGGEQTGIIESFRLYVIWSIAYFIIFSLLLHGNAFLVFHKAIVFSGIIISTFNLIALFDFMNHLGWISSELIAELQLYINFLNGYVRLNAYNIGSLFFIVAYLIAVQFRKDMNCVNNSMAKLSLLMCVIVVGLSGRRALWLVTLGIPLLAVCLTFVCHGFDQLKWRKTLLMACVIFLVPVLGIIVFLVSGNASDNSVMFHLQHAFSAVDERSIQMGYLFNGFLENPILGSGFGGVTEYVRSETRPWLYELTYQQMLFNFGIVGILLLAALYIVFLRYILQFMMRDSTNAGFGFCLLISIIALAIGAYSNPYFGSFDLLLLVGVIPMIASSFYTNKPVGNTL